MKRFFSVVSVSLLAVVALSTVAICVFLQKGRWGEDVRGDALFCPGIDFTLRVNEAQCLLEGVDPFDVWSEAVQKPPYFAYYPEKDLSTTGFRHPINAYPPWEYPLMMPLTTIPRQVAWLVFFVEMFLCGALLFYLAYRKGRVLSGDVWGGLLVASIPLLVLSYPLFANISVGNYSLHIMAALALAIVCMNRGADVLAGVFWALAMIKPQMSLLFAVPLLLRGKWRTCFTAGFLCVLAGIPAVLLCGKSFVALCREAPAATAHYFLGCGTYPYLFCGRLPVEMEIGIGLAVGLVVCLWMTWRVRAERDWWFLAMPAIACSACWSYANPYVHALEWFFLVVLVLELIRVPRSKFLWTVFLLSVLPVSRVFRCFYGVAVIYGMGVKPLAELSVFAQRVLESLNTTFTLALVVVFSLWKQRDLKTRKEYDDWK